ECHDLMPVVEQPLDQMRPDEAGRAGHEDVHRAPSRASSPAVANEVRCSRCWPMHTPAPGPLNVRPPLVERARRSWCAEVHGPYLRPESSGGSAEGAEKLS